MLRQNYPFLSFFFRPGQFRFGKKDHFLALFFQVLLKTGKRMFIDTNEKSALKLVNRRTKFEGPK